MAAALRPNLILKEHTSGSQAHELLHGANDIDNIAISRVRVDDHRRLHHGADTLRSE